jgi:hypothetical protein
MEDHLDGVVEQDDGEPQARHLAIQNEPFGFFELDDRPAQAFHTSILKQVLVRPPSLTLRRGSPRVESAREPSGWSDV